MTKNDIYILTPFGAIQDMPNGEAVLKELELHARRHCKCGADEYPAIVFNTPRGSFGSVYKPKKRKKNKQ